MGVTYETLKGGKILRILVNEYNQDPTTKNLLPVLGCLRDSYIWIPCNVEMSQADAEMFSKVSKGEIVRSFDDIKMIPDILKNGDNLFFPVFSNCEQMGEDYGSNFSKIEKHFFEAMSMAMAREDVCGIVLDAFTQPLVIDKELFEIIGKLPSQLDE